MTDGNSTIARFNESTIIKESIDRSILIEEAVERFLALRRTQPAVTPKEIAAAYRKYGPALESSVVRQIEVEKYLLDQEVQFVRPEPVKWPSIGETLGGFRVLEQLGRGAFARVYLCVEPKLAHRQMVLKVGRASSREVETLSRLQHPGIVPIYSVLPWGNGEDCVICMPFLGRSTLADLIAILSARTEPWDGQALLEAGRMWIRDSDSLGSQSEEIASPPSDLSSLIIRVAKDIAIALDYAHRQRVVHGDIKPSNVLLTPAGRSVLLDFNLSGETSGAWAAVGGTLPYMPPEQLQQLISGGNANVYSPRSDLFSFGACLFELATGRPPVTSLDELSTPQLAARQAMRSLAANQGRWSLQLTKVDPRLAHVIAWCLSLDQRDRPASAAEFLQTLESLESVRGRFRRFAWRRKAELRWVGGGLAGGCLLVAGYVISREPLPVRLAAAAAEARRQGRLDEAVEALEEAVSLRPASTKTQYALGWTLLDKGDLKEARRVFHAIAATHPKANAAMAYAFQLEGEASVAVAWYNRALENGDARVAVLNNAAVAHELGRTRFSRDDDLRTAATLLEKALDQESNTPLLLSNLVAIEMQRYQRGDSAALPRAKSLARRLALLSPPDAQLVAIALVAGTDATQADVETAIDMLQRSIELKHSPSPTVLLSRAWIQLTRSPRFSDLVERARQASKLPKKPARPWARLLSVE